MTTARKHNWSCSNFVDRFFAEMHQIEVPTWSTWFADGNKQLDVERMVAAVSLLVEEVPRLRVEWNPAHRRFALMTRTAKQCQQIITHQTDYPSEADLFKTRINLCTDIPLRIHLFSRAGHDWTLAMQLHHAIGDGRSLLLLTRRFWELYHGRGGRMTSMPSAAPTDFDFLKRIGTRPCSFLRLLHSRNRMFSRRAHALRRDGQTLGSPTSVTARIPLARIGTTKFSRSELFWAAILAAIRKHDREGQSHPIRLRIPVDLRSFFAGKNAIGNFTTAIPIEIPMEHFVGPDEDPTSLCGSVPMQLRRLLSSGAHWSSIYEGLMISRLAGINAIKNRIARDVINSPKCYTLNATFMGQIDKYISEVPVDMMTTQCHSPVWGVIGYVAQQHLFINVTAFSGIWSDLSLIGFAGNALEWFSTVFGVDGVLLPRLKCADSSVSEV